MPLNPLTIGVTGVALNNGNLGCQALAYSSIAMLERVAREMGVEFRYVIFEGGYDETKTGAAIANICDKVGVASDHITALREVGHSDFLRAARHPRRTIARHKMLQMLHSVDVVFDLTQGDSFTDMYDGGRRLNTFAQTREAAFKLGIPVILGPQTIGPFDTNRGKEIARRTLCDAELVIARDGLSRACAKRVAGIDVPVTTDLAFGLPYNREERHADGRPVRIGFNPSGLLVHDAFEGGFDTSDFRADYDTWLHGFSEWLERTGWEVHLISHVIGGDMPVCLRIKEAHPDFVLHDDFDNPVDAKSLISTMDVFIGSRMHATIAALSSGVPVVPVAYSRKFVGLFNSLGYNVNVDLKTLDTSEVLAKTESLTEHYLELMPRVEAARSRADERLDQTRDILAEYLLNRVSGVK